MELKLKADDKMVEIPIVDFKEDKQEILNAICDMLRLTSAAGHPLGNRLDRIEYIDNGDKEIARPIFEDGNGKNGYYDVNITYDSGIAIVKDVMEHFVNYVW